MSNDRLVLMDLETFGLNPKTDFILEIGFEIVDLDFNVFDVFQRCVWDTPAYDGRYDALRLAAQAGDTSSQFVLDMHQKSDLWQECRQEGVSVQEAITDTVNWLNAYGVNKTDPIVGSSIGFDRSMLCAQMPEIDEIFSYRSIDISSTKELCMRYNPDLYARLDEVTNQQKLHRSLSDIDDSIEELRFYRDEFLLTAF